MKSLFEISTWSFVFCFVQLPNSLAQTIRVKQVALRDFTMQSAAVIRTPGDSLSDPGYQSRDYWFPVKVPCTVLTGLVANRVYPDPYIGLNNMLIPDASDSFNHQYQLEQFSYLPNDPNPWKKPYWFCTRFFVPASDEGSYFQLVFKGINYRSEVWLNGKLLADSAQMVGMFAEYRIDASASIRTGSMNALAVRIFPLDFPGLPSHPQLQALGDFYANGGPTGDIGKNVTMVSSIGWDWIPEVRDRNIGIWQPVYLRTSGKCILSRPQIVAALPSLPDTSVARLSIDLDAENHSGARQKLQIEAQISPEFSPEHPLTVSQEFFLEAGGARHIRFTPDSFASLIMHQPRLWWPNGYGRPELYRLHLQLRTGGQISDDSTLLFGIRTVSSQVQQVNGWARRDFYVNGKKIQLVGGAWVPDMMLNRDRQRYDYELRMCRNGHVNLVRIWGGGIGETDDFYELADRYGLLVWQDFWITGDTHGGFKGSADWPVQGNVFIRNIISTIYRIRNHPSLLVWTGGNEGHAREELYNAMRDNVEMLDGTRPFIPSSSGFARQPNGWKGSWPDNQPSGVYSGGPYSWQDPEQYYRLVDRGRDWVFKDEVGLPSQPPYESLPKIINNLVPDKRLPYPLNDTWGYHDACVGNGKYDLYYQAMVNEYGSPSSMADFSEKMQLMNAQGYRGIFEAAGHKLTETGGVMLWKLNAAFPSVIWQVYDWFLEPNAGYYYMQNACEPAHIQLNLDDSAVAVVNRTYHALSNWSFQADLLGLDGKVLDTKKGSLSLDSYSVKELISLRGALQGAPSQPLLVFLRLRDQQDRTVSENCYWLSTGHDYARLNQMPDSRPKAKLATLPSTKQERRWLVQISNPGPHVAFFLRAQLNDLQGEILPSFWSANYFSLEPGGQRSVTVGVPTDCARNGPVTLTVEGWNTGKITVAP